MFKRKSKLLNTKDQNSLIQYNRVQPWFAVNGDETLRLDYDLNELSIVFDVGGYKGEFARDIFCKYQSEIFIFEPLPEFYHVALLRFIKNKKVKVYNFGLSDKTCKTLIEVANNASSTLTIGENAIQISLVSILDFIEENKIAKVDLIKLNIEGGEYGLLEAILEKGNVKMFENIQVQFHDFVIPNANERMQKIQTQLAATHELTYQYEFVWENWRRK